MMSVDFYLAWTRTLFFGERGGVIRNSAAHGCGDVATGGDVEIWNEKIFYITSTKIF